MGKEARMKENASTRIVTTQRRRLAREVIKDYRKYK